MSIVGEEESKRETEVDCQRTEGVEESRGGGRGRRERKSNGSGREQRDRERGVGEQGNRRQLKKERKWKKVARDRESRGGWLEREKVKRETAEEKEDSRHRE